MVRFDDDGYFFSLALDAIPRSLAFYEVYYHQRDDSSTVHEIFSFSQIHGIDLSAAQRLPYRMAGVYPAGVEFDSHASKSFLNTPNTCKVLQIYACPYVG